MLERFAFAIYLVTIAGSCGLIGLGLLFALLLEEVRPLCVGLAGGALVQVLRQHGYRVWHFAQWEDSFEPSDARSDFGEDAVPVGRVGEFVEILRALEAGGDVWAVQELRHQARALLAAEPGLRERYAEELAEHPELG